MPPKTHIVGPYEVPRHNEAAGIRIRAALARLVPLENQPIFNSRGLHIGEKPARAITLSIPRLHVLEGRVSIWRGSEIPTRTAFNTFKFQTLKTEFTKVVTATSTGDPVEHALGLASPQALAKSEDEDEDKDKDKKSDSGPVTTADLIREAVWTTDDTDSHPLNPPHILETIETVDPRENRVFVDPLSDSTSPPTIEISAPSPTNLTTSYLSSTGQGSQFHASPTSARSASLGQNPSARHSSLAELSLAGLEIDSHPLGQAATRATATVEEQGRELSGSENVSSTPSLSSGGIIMAPVQPPDQVSSTIKNVIQNLYEVQSQVHGYQAETQDLLVDRVTELAQQLSHLKALTDPAKNPDDDIQKALIAREIIDYVDDSRNPDIYTRDFVELVQRGNAVINGKQQAFSSFSEILAEEIKKGIPGVDRQVDRIMRNAGAEGASSGAREKEKENGKG